MDSNMPRNKAQLYLDDEIVEVLEAISKIETRTVPNLMEALIIEALRNRGAIQTPIFKPVQEKEKA